jgi:hypothetical protein
MRTSIEGLNMYTIYLRAPDQSISERTNTPFRMVALAAFTTLLEKTEFDGTRMRAILNVNDIALAHHRFDCAPGSDDHWRGRVGQLEVETAGGARFESAGGRHVTIYLDHSSLTKAIELGNGDPAEGIRLALLQPIGQDDAARSSPAVQRTDGITPAMVAEYKRFDCTWA